MAHEAVVLLTTWNRPNLLRQSLPQIEREADRIGARLVIADDQSSDPETRALLIAAQEHGADLIRRPYARAERSAADVFIHHERKAALRHLIGSTPGSDMVGQLARNQADEDALSNSVIGLWSQAIDAAHENAQRNNLFGFGHVLTAYERAQFILKVDDDVALEDGAFERMLSTWEQAEGDGHDVLTVSGLRTVYQAVIAQWPTYAITRGMCSVAALYRGSDWIDFRERTAESLILRDGFDLAFVQVYAPAYRPAAAAVSVTPSAVYHTGFNGLHVRNLDLNCEYGGNTEGIVVQ
jgi:glycosyltransferase involved in cell wall biosynthesis